MHLLKKVSLFCTCAVLLLACPAMADTSWPTKPVTLMVSNSVGGMVDVTSRILADGMLKILGQPLVIQNLFRLTSQFLKYTMRKTHKTQHIDIHDPMSRMCHT